MTNQKMIEISEEEYELLKQISSTVPRLVNLLIGDAPVGYQQEEAECAKAIALVRRLPQRNQSYRRLG